MNEGTLYIVATPIGNLEDITLRAIRILKEVDIIFAEDTRVTKKLLNKYEIETPIKRLDAHTEMKQMDEVIERIKNGETVALVSDAGTPSISDPGYRAVAHARESGAHVEVIPGASSLTAALSIAGVKANEFVFLGFPPHKKGRKTFFENVLKEDRAVVFYESSHRILKALESLGNTKIVVARELTKMHEEILDDSADKILQILTENPQKQKGEFVVIIEP